ncbi:phage holin family protein [Aeromicrobium sp. CTD01-1L150]|uniref:phage holin family protein n=1 Tax=Aeromicrobium sp. CTD01-1L150 TaxID=3341830 RepID=UPI0035BEC5C7
MIRLLTAWVLNAAALAAAAWLLGEQMSIGTDADPTDQRLLTLAAVAAVFTIVNQIITPIVKLLALPFIILTLGLALLVINALMLLLTQRITELFDVEFAINGFWWAVAASIVISIVNAVLGSLTGRERR